MNSYRVLRTEPDHAMISAALCSVASDDEGSFPCLLDLLDFSGENKAVTVIREALRAAIVASPVRIDYTGCTRGELAIAAAHYAYFAGEPHYLRMPHDKVNPPIGYPENCPLPWNPSNGNEPSDRIYELVKAVELISAEIERLSSLQIKIDHGFCA